MPIHKKKNKKQSYPKKFCCTAIEVPMYIPFEKKDFIPPLLLIVSFPKGKMTIIS